MRLTRVIPALVSLVAFAYFLAVLPSTVYWLDAPEFVAAAWNLGLPHPPGHPVMVVLLKGFLLLPIGDAAFRANLFSAVFGALSAGVAARIAMWASSRTGAGDKVAAMAGVAVGLGFAAAGSMVTQSQSVEVYTFNLALVLGALWVALDRPGNPRAGVACASLAALGLANHHFLTLLAMPAIAFAYFREGFSWKVARGAWPVVVAVGAIVCGSYAYLWARGLAGAWPTWADTTTLDGVIWVATARIFSTSLGGFEDPVSGVLSNLAKAAWLLTDDVSPVGLVVALGGLYLLGRSGSWRDALVLGLLSALGLASKVSMGILDPLNPDDHGYFLPVLAGVMVLAGACWSAMLARASSLAGVAGHALSALTAFGMVCAIAIPASFGAGPALERADFGDAPSFARLVWDETPPRSVLFLSHYAVFFQAQYSQVVEGSRPDVTLVQQSLYHKARGGAFYAEGIAGRDPDLRPLADRFIASSLLDWDEVLRLSVERPVRIEAAPDMRFPPSNARLAGWTFDVGSGPDPAMDARGAARHLGLIRRTFAMWPPSDLETGRTLLFHLASTAEVLERQGSRGAARAMVDAALEINPHESTLLRMKTRL